MTLLLYALVVLIWGSTWLAITFQLGEVPIAWSLVYRFGLASLVLFAWALVTRVPLRLTPRQHPMVALQGMFMFCINYAFVYQGTQYVTSGLVAVLFTMLLFFNLVNERLFFGTPFSRRVVAAAVLGFTGIMMVYWPELEGFHWAGDGLKGPILILIAALSASLGNMAAIRNTREQLSVITLNAWGILYGTGLLTVYALLQGLPPGIDLRSAYLLSLLYLAIPGTALAFGFYLALIRRIGASRAAYSNILFPVVALLMSTAFEGYRWTAWAVAGLLLALAGNALALTRRRAQPSGVAAAEGGGLKPAVAQRGGDSRSAGPSNTTAPP
jgi:drug/metabolite transporter (DMT)-like permease